jgi:tetratricopeptide (TPR) repeat protein
MYVDGKLMEGGMAERGHAAEVYEGIVRRMQDPAILEWLEGSTFRLRIFPFEPYTERRILLSYQQPLESLYDLDRYRFPLRRPATPWESFSIHAVLKGAVQGGWQVSSPTYPLQEVARGGGDVELALEEKDARPERDVVLEIRRPRRPPVELATHQAGGERFVSVRVTPEVAGEPYRGPRRALLIVDRTGSPTDSERRAIRRAARRILGSLDRKDRFAAMTYGTEPTLWRDEFVPRTKESLAAALGFLDGERFFGAGDLERAFRRAARLFGAPEEGDCIFYVGDGVDSMSGVERERIAGALPASVRFFAIPVSRSYDRTLLGSLAERSGGRLLPLSQDERIGWRVFDLVSSLRTPEWRDLDWELLDADGHPVPGDFRADRRSLRDGESLWIAGRLEGPAPRKLRLGRETMALPEKARDGAWIPRLWAKLRIEALERDSQAEHQGEIVRLSKDYYVMTPFTALLVLENEAMYSQYKIDRGRKDHWALYEAPSAWKGRVVRPTGPEVPSQPVIVWNWNTWGVPTDRRVWYRNAVVPGEDGIVNTPDDRILLSGGGASPVWTNGVDWTTPSSEEILLPPGGFTFSENGAWISLDGAVPTSELADRWVRTFAPEINYQRFRDPSFQLILSEPSGAGQDRWAGRVQHPLDGFTYRSYAGPGGGTDIGFQGAVVLSFRAPLAALDTTSSSFAWTGRTGPSPFAVSTAPLFLSPFPPDASVGAAPETLRRYLDARGETAAVSGKTRFAAFAGGGRLVIEGKRAAYVGPEGAAAIDPLFETPTVGGFAAAEAARLPWFLSPLEALISGLEATERKEGDRTVISLDGGGWTTLEIVFEGERPVECRETLRGGYVLRCHEYDRWEKVGGALLPTHAVARGPAGDAASPGEVLDEIEYRYGPMEDADREVLARLREAIARVADSPDASMDRATASNAGTAAGAGACPPEILERAFRTGAIADLEPTILATKDPGLWVRELQRILERAPEGLHGLIQLWIGDLAVRNGWNVTAREAYGVAAAWAPLAESATLQDRLRQVALSLGEVETAIAHGEKALQLLEARGASAAVRAASLAALADAADRKPELRRDRGRAFLERWAELEPRNEVPFRRLALIHEEAGRKTEAVRFASQRAELAPSEESYSTLAAQLERLGDAERAAACRRIAAKYASARGG